MSILEPCIVWCHPASQKSAQALHCADSFLDGNQQASSCPTVHGVYEGSYWRLLTDAKDLRSKLARLAAAPPELPLPELILPQEPADLLWEDFAPALQPVESMAPVPPLVLPAFQQPRQEVRTRPILIMPWFGDERFLGSFHTQ